MLESLLSMDNTVNDPVNSLHIYAETSIEGRSRNHENVDS
jgi:hypothetical protein